MNCYPPHQQSGEGNVFSNVCLSFCPRRELSGSGHPPVQGLSPCPSPPLYKVPAPPTPCTRPQPLLPPSDMFKIVQLGSHCNRDPLRHVQTCSIIQLRPHSTGTPPPPPPPDIMFKLVQLEPHCPPPPVIGLKCLLVNIRFRLFFIHCHFIFQV